YYFFFQAEDGIRCSSVTGVQTCALPICRVLHRDAEARRRAVAVGVGDAARDGVGAEGEGAAGGRRADRGQAAVHDVRGRGVGEEIGRASCRERGGEVWGGVGLE